MPTVVYVLEEEVGSLFLTKRLFVMKKRLVLNRIHIGFSKSILMKFEFANLHLFHSFNVMLKMPYFLTIPSYYDYRKSHILHNITLFISEHLCCIFVLPLSFTWIL